MAHKLYCPSCGKSRTDIATQFCTGCGMDMTGVDRLVENHGSPGWTSQTGIRQGVSLLIVGFLLIPVWMFVGAAFPPADKLVEGSPSTTAAEAIAWILMWVAFLAGAGRIAYSLIFDNRTLRSTKTDRELPRAHRPAALHSADAFQAAEPGRWKVTDELLEPVLNRRTSGDLG